MNDEPVTDRGKYAFFATVERVQKFTTVIIPNFRSVKRIESFHGSSPLKRSKTAQKIVLSRRSKEPKVYISV
jgi:hypothetical protein